MDPEATLQLVKTHFTKGKKASGYRAQQHFHDAGESLNDYWTWRRRGGFEPKNGDRRAEDLAEQISDAWEKLSDEEQRDRDVHEDWENNPTNRLLITADSEEHAKAKARKFGSIVGYVEPASSGKYYVTVNQRSNNPTRGLKNKLLR